MAEYVAKVHDPDLKNTLNDLTSFAADLRDAAKGQTIGEIRVSDPAEASAVADVVASLRDALGQTTRITYHVCRHDEGVGHCTPEDR